MSPNNIAKLKEQYKKAKLKNGCKHIFTKKDSKTVRCIYCNIEKRVLWAV
jgi:hypothetical protein